jgi:hypothetical protein
MYIGGYYTERKCVLVQSVYQKKKKKSYNGSIGFFCLSDNNIMTGNGWTILE